MKLLFPPLQLSHEIKVFLCETDYRSSVGSGSVILDDCNFHESVRLDNFDVDKTLTLVSETNYTR